LQCNEVVEDIAQICGNILITMNFEICNLRIRGNQTVIFANKLSSHDEARNVQTGEKLIKLR